MATKIPTTKSLQFLYPELNKVTARLCRDIMHRQLDPAAAPTQFTLTAAAMADPIVDTPPRVQRMLALRELARIPLADETDDQDALSTYGVRALNLGTRSKPRWLYWLLSPHGDHALTLCSLPPPPAPDRLAMARDPWLYRDYDPNVVERYRIAVPTTAAKKLTRETTRSK